MCQFKSGVAVRSGKHVKLYTLENEDSHNTIREKHGLKDDYGHSGQNQCPLEYVPVGSFTNHWEDWKLVFDDARPDWWTEQMTEEATAQFHAEVLKIMDEIRSTGNWIGHRDLRSLTSAKGLESLKTAGDMDLGSLTSAKGLESLKTAGDMRLDSLTSAKGLESLKTAGYMDLHSLTSAKGLESLKTAGNMDLRSLTSAKGLESLKTAGNMYLSSLTSAKGLESLKTAGDMDLRSLPENERQKLSRQLGNI